MTKMVCLMCGYVYEEEQPMPDDYSCPICGAGKDQFEEVK